MGRHFVADHGEIGPDTKDNLPGFAQSLELQRYGGWMNPYFTPYGCSALETQHPLLESLSMDWPNDMAANAYPLPVPPSYDLDRMFLAERFQQITNDGFKAWQIPSLHEGTRPFSNITITVNPQKWHPIFQKHRWYDLKSPIHHTDRSPSAPCWSIDNPDVFAELGVCIEMANKMFAEAINTKWMKGLLFDAEEVIRGTKLMKCNQLTNKQAYQFGPRDNPDGPLRQEWRVRNYNETASLADRIIWTFYDGDDPDAFGFLSSKDDKFTTAFTNCVEDKDTGEFFVAIRMNARILRALLLDLDGTERPSENLRTVEKHIARLQFAATVCMSPVFGRVHVLTSD